jgi:hypothetical protein
VINFAVGRGRAVFTLEQQVLILASLRDWGEEGGKNMTGKNMSAAGG